MTTGARHPSSVLQLELPLETPPAPSRARSGDDWRLDERTRRIGRQGVAAARARLSRPVPVGEQGADQARPGRAA